MSTRLWRRQEQPTVSPGQSTPEKSGGRNPEEEGCSEWPGRAKGSENRTS